MVHPPPTPPLSQVLHDRMGTAYASPRIAEFPRITGGTDRRNAQSALPFDPCVCKHIRLPQRPNALTLQRLTGIPLFKQLCPNVQIRSLYVTLSPTPQCPTPSPTLHLTQTVTALFPTVAALPLLAALASMSHRLFLNHKPLHR